MPSRLATQYLAPYMARLDVSLKGCADARFNTRYDGHLMVSDSSKEAKLRLTGLVISPDCGICRQEDATGFCRCSAEALARGRVCWQHSLTYIL